MAKFTWSVASAIIAFLAASSNAHMKMKTPVPYGASTLDNSPIKVDGSDFPCKQRPGVYDAEGASNVMAIGEPQTLSFIGSAVHGGGSCQVSLTTDLQPTLDTKWMVIKSIEGGCPSNISDNFPADANGNLAATFEYTVPEGITPGQYTIAWSWSNKIGNREFYMNCGPATVTAAKKKRYAPSQNVKRQSTFPDMFVANVPTKNDCKTPETYDYVYPDPGAYVQSAGTGPYTTLSCDGAGGGAAQQPTATTDAGAPAATGGASGAATTGSPAVFASGAASAPAAESAPASAPSSSSSTGSNVTGSNITGSTSTVVGAQSGPCTDEGAWSCSADGKSFQRCASGQWSATIEMAEGTACTPGVSDTFSMIAAKLKRNTHKHLRRVAAGKVDHVH